MRALALLLAPAILLASTAAEARGSGRRCVEAEVPVVGRAVCRARFGRWDVTPAFVDEGLVRFIGAEWHRLLLPPRTFDAALTVHHVTGHFALAGARLGASRGDAGTARFGLEVMRVGPVRLGPTLELGGGGVTGAPSFSFQAKSYTLLDTLYFSGGLNAAAGADLGPILLRGELFVGGQHLEIATRDAPPPKSVLRLLMFNTPSGPPPDGLVLSENRFRLAPRVSLEAWLGDYVTVGVGGAMDFIYRDDFSAGVFLRSYLDKRGVRDPRR